MQVSVEAPSKIERRITVTVPAERLEEVYDKRITKLSKTVKIDGFRPGKVPLDFVKQRFGEAARQEALSELITSSLYDAFHQENLKPVGTPLVEPKTIVPGQPLEFTAIVEIVPLIERINFDLKTIEKRIATVTEKEVDHVIERLRDQQVTWQPVDRAAQEKDQVVIDFLGMIEGVPFTGGKATNYPIILGSKTMIPGFEEGVVGMKAGEEKTIPVPFPANYFAKEVAGKTAEFKIKLHRVSQPQHPELNEAFAKKMGIKTGNLDDLRTEIRKNLQRELERVIKLKLKAQVFDKLLEQNPLEIPQALIQKEAERIHHQMHPHHQGKEHGHSEAEMAMFKDAAKRNVALGLLVAELVKNHNVTPDNERVQTLIASMSTLYEDPKEVATWYAKDKRALAEIEMQVLEDQLVEKLLESIEITEKMMSYSELVNTQ